MLDLMNISQKSKYACLNFSLKIINRASKHEIDPENS